MIEPVLCSVRRGFDAVLANTSFILGKEVKQFEEAFARFVGAKHCIGVANGTDALELAGFLLDQRHDGIDLIFYREVMERSLSQACPFMEQSGLGI